jgi:hypothetical protein
MPRSLELMAIRTLEQEVRFEQSAELIGRYGGHSPVSLEASQSYDRTGIVQDAEGNSAPDLWLCGHFVGKALVALLDELSVQPDAHVLLWQTKSAVQPRGPADEWERFQRLSVKVHVCMCVCKCACLFLLDFVSPHQFAIDSRISLASHS